VDLSVARTSVADDLAVTGIRVATDPAKAQAPCVLVGPITRIEVGGPDVWHCEIPVWLIAPAPGNDRAVAWLAEHVTKVMAALGYEVTTATLGSYDVGQGALPAYEMTVTYLAEEE
jgi:hypothetical protein